MDGLDAISFPDKIMDLVDVHSQELKERPVCPVVIKPERN